MKLKNSNKNTIQKEKVTGTVQDQLVQPGSKQESKLRKKTCHRDRG